MTPREFNRAVRAENRRSRAEQRQRAWTVWHTAALLRAKRMPSLTAIAGEPDAPQVSSDERERMKAEHEKLVERQTARRQTGSRQNGQK